MGFFKKRLASLAQPEAPAVDPVEMTDYLSGLSDLQWGRYAFSREPLEGKFTQEQKDAYTRAANGCGAQWADRMAERFHTRAPFRIAEALGLRVETPSTPAGGGQVLFAQFVQPDEITIFTDCIDKAMTMDVPGLSRQELERIILAHELFHAVEEQNPDIYTRSEKVELWRKPFSNRSSIACLSEIAAMAFAKRLLDLPFNPYALDVLLVYPYDANAACGLYAEICDLMKEV